VRLSVRSSLYAFSGNAPQARSTRRVTFSWCPVRVG
jgi:hypothetical protein